MSLIQSYLLKTKIISQLTDFYDINETIKEYLMLLIRELNIFKINLKHVHFPHKIYWVTYYKSINTLIDFIMNAHTIDNSRQSMHVSLLHDGSIFNNDFYQRLRDHIDRLKNTNHTCVTPVLFYKNYGSIHIG